MSYQATLRRPLFAETFIVLGVSWLLLLSMFYAVPSLDIRISEFFFRQTICASGRADIVCGVFPLASVKVFKVSRWVLYELPFVAAFILLFMALSGTFVEARRAQFPVRRLWLSLMSLAISTGFIVNELLKEHSGRPRPVQSTLFGGQLDFMPAGSFQGACAQNCSFISGEASGAGWLFCLLFLLTPRYRSWLTPPVLFISLSTCFLRVAFGAHFVSDVVLGWLLSLVIFAGLLALDHRFFEKR